MRLKLLIFPLTLLVAISLAIGYIYPIGKEAWDTSKQINEKKAILSNFKNKQENVKSLGADLNANQPTYDFVMSYFPSKVNEERVINWVYKSAQDTFVALLGVGFRDGQEAAADTNTGSAFGMMSVELSENSPQALPGLANSIEQALNGAQKQLKVESRYVDINVLGKYEQIQKFIQALQKRDQLGEISSLSIIHVGNNEQDSASGEKENQSGNIEGGKQINDNLQAKISLKLQYAQPLVLNSNYTSKVFDQGKFDYTGIQKVRASLNKLPEIPNAIAGDRTNPFLP